MKKLSARPGVLLSTGEVARLLRLDPRTVGAYARAGKIRSVKTPGGHRRYHPADVEAFLNGRKAGTP